MAEIRSRTVAEPPVDESSAAEDAAKEKKRAKRAHKAIIVIFASLLVDLIGFTCILPLMPSILEYYGRKASGDGLYGAVLSRVRHFKHLIGAPDTERYDIVLLGGLIGSLFSLLQFVASPAIGALSDVYGRRPILLGSIVGVGASYVIWAASNDFGLFVVARVVGGLSKGNVSLCTAIVADVTSAKTRSRGMAVIGVAFSFGFLIGPMLGALFSRYSPKSIDVTSESYPFSNPALFALCLTALGFVLLWLLFDETLPSEKRAKSLGSSFADVTTNLINPVNLFRFDAVSSLSASQHKRVRLLGVAYFLFLLLFSGLEYSLTFLTHHRFHYTGMEQGKMFLYIGIIMIAVQGGYLRRRPPGSEMKTACQGIVVLIPGIVMVAFAHGAPLLYAGLALYSFGAGTVVPSITSVVSQFGNDDEKGTLMGILRSLGALSRALGPVAACTVYWSIDSVTCYVGGAVLLLIPLAMLSRSS